MNKVIQSFLVILFVLFCWRNTATCKELPRQISEEHQFSTANNLNVGRMLSVTSSFTAASGLMDRNSTGLIHLQIRNDGENVPEHQYSLQVSLDVQYTLLNGTVRSEEQKLLVEYDPKLAQGANAENFLVRFSDVKYLSVEVTDVKITNNTSSQLPQLLNCYLQLVLEEEVFVRPPEIIGAGSSIGFVSPINGVLPPLPGENPLIRISLPNDNASQYVDGYEIQWDFIDAYSIPQSDFESIEQPTFENLSPKTAETVDFDFERSASSVFVEKPIYQWNSVYGIGYVVYRYRYYSFINGEKKSKIYSDWSCGSNCRGKVGDLSSDYWMVIDNAWAHRPRMNWVYQMQFAEEGKRKESIEYFDGLNRGRQRVSMQQSNTEAIVSESILDIYGRPVIDVLPSPTNKPEFDFYPGQSLNSVGQPYSYRDLILSPPAGDCSAPAGSPMSTLSGASNYYSSIGSKKVKHDFSVPDAQGFPFVQTEFDFSEDGRIIRKSLPGFAHSFASGEDHTTRFTYANVGQSELDRLFGTDVGGSSYYKKVVTTDPNGQSTIAYIDNQGRTIASALLSGNPANMDQIDMPNGVDKIILKDNILEGLSTTGEIQNVIQHTYPIVVVEDGTEVSFHYELSQKPLEEKFCDLGIEFCYDCRYTIELSLVNECGESIAPFPMVHAIGWDQSPCSSTPFTSPNVKVNLNKGKYTVIKTLKLDQTYFEQQLEDYLENNKDCMVSLDKLIEEELSILDVVSCNDKDCEKQCELAGSDPFEIILCKNSCKESNQCESRLSLLELDVQPGGLYGGYTEVNGAIQFNNHPYSIFNSSSPFYFKNQLVDYNTTDNNGDPIDLSTKSGEYLIRNWYNGWAVKLLQAHPEYDCYQQCVTMNSSSVFVDVMQFVESYQEAMQLGFFDPWENINANVKPQGVTTNNKDPLVDLLSNSDVDSFGDKMVEYANINGVWYSIWQLAYGMANCKNAVNFNNCVQNISYPPSTDGCQSSELWRVFRGLYLALRMEYLKKAFENVNCHNEWQVYSGDFSDLPKRFSVPSAEDIEKILEDNDSQIGPYDPGNVTTSNKDKFDANCESACESRAVAWVNQLTGCLEYDGLLVQIPQPTKQEIRNNLINGFKEVCSCSCTPENPEGTVECPSGSSPSGYTSFEDVINKIIPEAYGLSCNEYLIGDIGRITPKLKVESHVPVPDACACEAYLQANDEWQNKGFNSIGEYLEYLYGNSSIDASAVACRCNEAYIKETGKDWYSDLNPDKYNLSENVGFQDELTNLLEDQGEILFVIPDVTCTECVSCVELFGDGALENGIWNDATLHAELLASRPAFRSYGNYTEAEEIQLRETVIQNYLNRNLGMRLTYPEYLDFKSTCDNLSNNGDCKFNEQVSRDLEFLLTTLLEEKRFYDMACLCYNPFDNFGSMGRRAYSNLLAEHVQPNFDRTSCDHEFQFNNISGGIWEGEINYDNGTSSCKLFLTKADDQITWEEKYLEHIVKLSELEMIPSGSGQSFNFKIGADILYEDNGQIISTKVYLKGWSTCFPIGLDCTNDPSMATLCEGEWELENEDAADGGNDCEEEKIEIATTRAIERYYDQRDQIIDQFREGYYSSCMQPKKEALWKEEEVNNYPFTLYYYDRVGNLVKTIPPLGFKGYETTNSINAVDVLRKNGQTSQPDHKMATVYEYNAVGEVLWHKSPDIEPLDATGSNVRNRKFGQHNWYNKRGQLVASQNGRQSSMNPARYSYLRYDKLGRVIETGEYTGSTPSAQVVENINFPLHVSNNRFDVTKTVYDHKDSQTPSVIEKRMTEGQKNLGGRVAAVLYFEQLESSTDQPEYGTYYSYDAHGNVEELVHNFQNPISASFHVAYKYDLISGNVKELHYQKGSPDAYYHRYKYDSDNRIIEVFTSNDGQFWERDAGYEYYRHGPLARTELGDQRVQGLDFAYTIHGWMKGVNSFALDNGRDIGEDGNWTSVFNRNRDVAKDAIALQLDYYDEDYFASSSISAFTTSSENSFNLFNGNIKTMRTGVWARDWNGQQQDFLQSIPKPNVNNTSFHYKYDQLNRIKKMWLDNNDENNGAFYTNYKYDFNGNIQLLERADETGALMDQLNYTYYSNSGTNAFGNRLERVDDLYSHASALDFKNNNTVGPDFAYDPAGNLNMDKENYISSIEWTHTGKVRRIVRDPDKIGPDQVMPDMRFYYDGMGNRVVKVVKTRKVNGIKTQLRNEEFWKTTLYVRDAQGNLLATYEMEVEPANNGKYQQQLALENHYLYGNNRMGRVIPQSPVNLKHMRFTPNGKDNEGRYIRTKPEYFTETAISPDQLFGGGGFGIGGSLKHGKPKKYLRGKKSYELSNHLGNVLATISDRKRTVFTLPTIQVGPIKTEEFFVHYQPDVISVSEYYPFGMPMPGRQFQSGNGYRYGFNGMERDDEIKGSGNSVSFSFRNYDPRLGRMWSVDPLAPDYPFWTPYAFAGNMPIWAGDSEGLQPKFDNIQDRRLKPVLEAKTPEEREAALQRKRAGEKAQAYGVLFGIGVVGTVYAGVASLPYLSGLIANYATNPAAQFATVEVASFAANLFYDGPDDPFPTPGPGGETAKLFKGVLKSIDKGLQSGKTTTILGRYYGGTKELIESGFEKLKGANILNVNTNLEGEDFWNAYNKGFLDDAMKRGDNFKLTHDPTDMSNRFDADGNITMFGREMDYLEDAGYQFNSETMEMVKPE